MANPTEWSLCSIRHVLFMIIIFFIISSPCSASLIRSYNVANYGARPGSTTDSSEAFVTAWNLACTAPKPATLYVPPGRFFLKSVKFQGPCKSCNITIRIDGTMVAPSDYNVIGDNQSWLYFKNVDGVTITGGTLDGQGRGLWDCKNNMSFSNCPRGATSLLIVNSNNIEINGLTSMDSQLFHIVIKLCNHVKLQGVQISSAGDSPNTDGIHVQQSAGVTILTSMIGTGDDCVSIGPGTNNLWIENVNCGPGHGISIGSLGKDYEEAGVQNVTVKTVTFSGTQNGARIKSWARPSTGYVKNVVFEDITVQNAGNPIIIDQNYCPHNEACTTPGGLLDDRVCRSHIRVCRISDLK
ncbi:unnamed protein product [Rhodiola kirilowii]